MGSHTEIHWADSTVNPTSGCDGCEILDTCYARGIHENRLAGSFPEKYDPSFLKVRLIPGRMVGVRKLRDLRGVARKDKPWIPRELPRLVFISDMADALSEGVPDEYLKSEIIDQVARWPHIGMWLTKRPKRMREFYGWMQANGFDWPDNLWAGTSVTSPKYLDRIKELAVVGNPWTVRFVSFEPLRGRCDFSEMRKLLWDVTYTEDGKFVDPMRMFDLAIIGGESGPKAHATDLTGMRDLIEMLREAEVKVFVKQLGRFPRYTANGGGTFHDLKLKDKTHGADWSEWPEPYRIREFPDKERWDQK